MKKITNILKNISPFNSRTQMPVIEYIIKVILAFGVCKVGGEILSGALTVLLHFPFGMNPLKGEVFEDPYTVEMMVIFGYAVMAGTVILYWKLFVKDSLSELGCRGGVGSYFAGAAAGAGMIVISVASVMLTGAVRYNGMFENADIKLIILSFFAFVFQGALEELICRGAVLQLLKKRTSIIVATGVSTALFIFPHLSAMTGGSSVLVFAGIANLTVLSLILSYITLRCNSIWPACGIHSVWNFILYSVLGLNMSGNDGMSAAVFDMRSVGSNILNGGEYGIEASIMTLAVLTVILSFCIGSSVIEWSRSGCAGMRG